MRHISCAALLAAVAACGDDTPATQPRQVSARQVEVRYTVERLPSLGGTQSRGMAINNQGCNDTNLLCRGFVWENGVM